MKPETSALEIRVMFVFAGQRVQADSKVSLRRAALNKRTRRTMSSTSADNGSRRRSDESENKTSADVRHVTALLGTTMFLYHRALLSGVVLVFAGQRVDADSNVSGGWPAMEKETQRMTSNPTMCRVDALMRGKVRRLPLSLLHSAHLRPSTVRSRAVLCL